MLIIFGSLHNAWYSRVTGPLAAGRMRVALATFPMLKRKRFNGMRFIFCSLVGLRQMRPALSWGRQTVWHFLSKRKPRTTLWGRNLASPFCSFFIERKSFPPLWLLIPGGRKMECMPLGFVFRAHFCNCIGSIVDVNFLDHISGVGHCVHWIGW
jgi:hypothetical protein